VPVSTLNGLAEIFNRPYYEHRTGEIPRPSTSSPFRSPRIIIVFRNCTGLFTSPSTRQRVSHLLPPCYGYCFTVGIFSVDRSANFPRAINPCRVDAFARSVNAQSFCLASCFWKQYFYRCFSDCSPDLVLPCCGTILFSLETQSVGEIGTYSPAEFVTLLENGEKFN